MRELLLSGGKQTGSVRIRPSFNHLKIFKMVLEECTSYSRYLKDLKYSKLVNSPYISLILLLFILMIMTHYVRILKVKVITFFL